MSELAVTKQVHDQIRLLGRAWGVTDGGVIARLIDEFQASAPSPNYASGGVPIHAIYQGVKTEAVFDPDTHRVEITTGPLASRSWKSPSGAAVALVRHANPSIRAERNGWGFWVVTATGETLQSLR